VTPGHADILYGSAYERLVTPRHEAIVPTHPALTQVALILRCNFGLSKAAASHAVEVRRAGILAAAMDGEPVHEIAEDLIKNMIYTGELRVGQ
jgi:hypothetical protein